MRVFLLTAAVAVLLLTATVALADEVCNGSIGAVTIDDNVVVPNGATCNLNGTQVEGNVLVQSGGTLQATGIRVDGNIQTDDGGAVLVHVTSSQIEGDVQVFDSSAAAVIDSFVDGNVQYEDNDSNLEVSDSTVNGDVQIFDNDGGVKEIRGNTIGGNLQCQGNEPPPVGGDNQVAGDIEGQCVDMEEGDGPGDGPGTSRFVDVGANHVFRAEIEALADSGITRGCNPPQNNRFCPDDSVSRGQMAAFLVRALDLTPGSATFTDVPAGHVFAADIAALADAGITRGCNPPQNNRFCPEETLTRGQMAAFLVRALDLTPGSATFTDVPAGHVFAADIAALADAGITRGCNPPQNDRFCPEETLTRGQMAAFLVRAGLAS